MKLKRERIKKSLHKPARKKLFISKINETKNFLFDSKINGNRKKDKIKIIFYEPGKNLFKPEEIYYKPVRIGNAFSSNYIEYKSNGNKGKTIFIDDDLVKLNHI